MASAVRTAPPRAHRAILAELGHAQNEIDTLTQEKVT
jgi:hypothetical protein